MCIPLTELYKKYCIENADHVSWGSFLNLRPFYVRHASLKDMEMCCCNLHLHGCWWINALLKIADKLGIPFLPSSYENFFANFYANCPDMSDTYIPWECTPNKKVVCKEITNNFSNITDVLEAADETTTVPFTYLRKANYMQC